MKKVGLFIIVCLLLAAFGTRPVAAQESEFGYIPLLEENYDSSLPRQMVSRQNFERILPLLMEERSKGTISDFSPDLYGGFVKVMYASKLKITELGGIAILANKIAASVKPLLSARTSTLRGAGPQIDMTLYSSCFRIGNIEANSHVKGTLTNSVGELLGFMDEYADADGYLWSCFDGYNEEVRPGLKVSFKIYNASEVLLHTYAVTAPRISFKTASKSSGIVTGLGAPGKNFEALWYHPKFNSTNDYDLKWINGTVSATGNWTADFATALKGYSEIDMYLYPNSIYSFGHYFVLPRLGCALGGDYCYLSGLPNKAVTMTLTHSGATFTASGKSDLHGYFYIYPLDNYAEPVIIGVGDKVTGTGATGLIIPKLTMILNRTGDKVTGIAPASKYFEVAVTDWSTWTYDWAWVGSSGTGAYTATFGMDIPASGMVRTALYYYEAATGNGVCKYQFNP